MQLQNLRVTHTCSITCGISFPKIYAFAKSLSLWRAAFERLRELAARLVRQLSERVAPLRAPCCGRPSQRRHCQQLWLGVHLRASQVIAFRLLHHPPQGQWERTSPSSTPRLHQSSPRRHPSAAKEATSTFQSWTHLLGTFGRSLQQGSQQCRPRKQWYAWCQSWRHLRRRTVWLPARHLPGQEPCLHQLVEKLPLASQQEMQQHGLLLESHCCLVRQPHWCRLECRTVLGSQPAGTHCQQILTDPGKDASIATVGQQQLEAVSTADQIGLRQHG